MAANMAAVHQGVPLILLEPLGGKVATLVAKIIYYFYYIFRQNSSDDVILLYDVRGASI